MPRDFNEFTSYIPGKGCTLQRDRRTGKITAYRDLLTVCVACGDRIGADRNHHCKEEKISRRNKIMAGGVSDDFFIS